MHAIGLNLHRTSTPRLAACAMLLCLATAVNAQAQKEKWTAYKYPADGFRISFPSAPKLEKNKKEAKSGTILMNSYCAQLSETYLCVAVSDQGPETTGLTPEALLQRTRLSVISAPKTHKLNEADLDLDGHKGVEIETENDTAHIFTRIYLVDRTLYQTMVTVPLTGRYPGTERFLNSFKLIARVRY